MSKFISEIKEEAKSFFKNAKSSHGWDHVKRVHDLALHIAKKESADLIVIELAAYLHDIGRDEQDKQKGKVCHAEIGATLAKGILNKYSDSLSKEQIENIVNCVKTHRFRNELVPETIEAKIIFDADKLDAIGAIGIMRATAFASEVGAKIHNNPEIDINKTEAYSEEDTAYREFYFKLSKIKNKIITNEGKRIAQERDKAMIEFFDRLDKEVKGEL